MFNQVKACYNSYENQGNIILVIMEVKDLELHYCIYIQYFNMYIHIMKNFKRIESWNEWKV